MQPGAARTRQHPMIRNPRHAATVAATALLVVISAAFVFPLLWMVFVSLKPNAEVMAFPPTILPQHPTLDTYKAIGDSEKFSFLLYARNTLIVLTLSLAGVLLSSSIAAYGFARIRFRGRGILFGVCLATMMIPFPVIMAPSYMLFAKLGWIGTFKPLWVPAWFASAFNVFLLRQFFLGVPRELEEAAAIDGCSRWGCFWRIMLPLARPALVVVALFHTLAVWNDLVGPLIYLTHQEQYTLALGLQTMQGRAGDTPWNELLAAATLIVLPVLALFVLAQEAFVRGIATTGLKG